jgi:hypothetical protein
MGRRRVQQQRLYPSRAAECTSATDSPDRLRDEAFRAAREAVRYDPKDEYSQWTLGMVLGSLLGRYEEAVSSL